MVRAEQVIESWRGIRQDTAAAVEEFPASEFDYRPTPDVMTFGEIARHILDAGDGLTGMLLAGEESFTGTDYREKLKRHMLALPAGADARSLAGALRESVERWAPALAAKSPEFYSHIVTRFDGQKVTRLEMLQTIKEHELTHRSQLFLYLRMKGIVPATTRRRMAKQASQ